MSPAPPSRCPGQPGWLLCDLAAVEPVEPVSVRHAVLPAAARPAAGGCPPTACAPEVTALPSSYSSLPRYLQVPQGP